MSDKNNTKAPLIPDWGNHSPSGIVNCGADGIARVYFDDGSIMAVEEYTDGEWTVIYPEGE